MNKIEAEAPEASSADVVAENLGHLKELFPDAFTEGKVDFDVLRQLLGDPVDDGVERYGLNWHGKRQARQLALTPSTGTLRPCPEESVDWDITKNLMIEGDNLEVLKLLQKSYARKVKLIYIDPPYNTGKDFVYRDDYRDNIRHYLEITGQVDGALRLSSSVETSGRFHTDWLNMMYPRLRLARELLAQDGVGFVSIDGGEASRCRLMLEEIFGEENVLATITWVSNLKGRQISDGGPVGTHEYIICFGRDARYLSQFRGSHSDLKKLMPAVYRGKTYEVKRDDLGPYVTKNELYNTNSRFNETTAPTMVFCIHHNFASSETRVTDVESPETFPGFVRIMPHDNAAHGYRYHAWRWSRSKIEEEAHELEFVPHGNSAKVYTKIRDIDGTALKDIVIGPSTGSGQKDLKVLGLAKAFDTPKPVELLRVLLKASAQPDALVLDFFAGSASAAHAVMAQNASDGGKRAFIMVQFPEALDRRITAQRAAATTCQDLGLPPLVSEITKERLRRAGRKIKEENPTSSGDLGFRVLKLDRSNIRSWNSKPEEIEGELLAAVDHIEPGRTEQDLLYELLLKLGFDLCTPIETRTISAHRVHAVGAGTLFACLEEKTVGEVYETLATGIADWHDELEGDAETTVVFRDSAFADDVTKANVAAILEQRGLTDVRSL
ncbi:MAG: site-specific DNA-methyltransferase [Acidobacteria bacterium]|nr:site-specific DNA-methyltransferase [Acidobacteriota bacterium]